MSKNFRFKKFSFLSIIIISVIIFIIILSLILSDFRLHNLKPISLHSYSSHKPFNEELDFLPKKFDLNPNNTVIHNNSIISHNLTIKSSNNLIINQTKFIINTDKTTLNANTSYKKLTYRIKSERLWFLTNGSLRPDPEISEKLAIWPNEGDPEDDRIINQLMYLPPGYSQQNSKLKTIYLNTDDFDWELSLGKKEFSKCPVNSCALVDKNDAPSADLIFFKVLSVFL